MNFYQRFRIHLCQPAASPRQFAAVPVVKHAAGGEDERKLFIRPFGWRQVLHDMESPTTARKTFGEQNRRARVSVLQNRPMELLAPL